MQKEYEIVGFERIRAGDLEPHPDAQLPMDVEDQFALGESLEERGVILPLLVLATPPRKNGCRLILDGVNRWAKLRDALGEDGT